MISDDLTQEIQRIDREALREFIDRKWDDEILPALTDYIAVPAKSPMFDLDWAAQRLYRTRDHGRCAMGRTATGAWPESGNHPLTRIERP